MEQIVVWPVEKDYICKKERHFRVEIWTMGKDLDNITMNHSNIPVDVFIKSQPPAKWQLLTDATFECLKRGFNINRMELERMARLLLNKPRQNAKKPKD